MRTLQIIIFASAAALAAHAAAKTQFTTVYTFTDAIPTGLAGANGVLYGSSDTGSDCGAVFELDPPAAGSNAWTETVLYSFAKTNDGCHPFFRPVLSPSGAIYGVTYQGGTNGAGTFYELQPPASPGGSWTERVLYNFGARGTVFGSPQSNLIAGPNGSFYLLAGALAQLQPPTAPGGAWTATLLYTFPPTTGSLTSLIAGPQGVLYGTIGQGPSGPFGEVFQLTPPATPGGSWTRTALHNFRHSGASAGNPNSVTLAPDGTLYGTTYGSDLSGAVGVGAAFQLTPPASPGATWTYTLLKNFRDFHPHAPLVLRGGNLYGAIAGMSGGGAVFELQPPPTPGGAWTTTYIHQFTGGEIPAGILLGGDGAIYGTSETSGTSAYGAVYRIAIQ